MNRKMIISQKISFKCLKKTYTKNVHQKILIRNYEIVEFRSDIMIFFIL